MADEGRGRGELASWKEIADYLQVTERTAQKWERERGLPVRRLAGERGRVSADPSQLDRWRSSVLEKPGWWTDLGFLRVYALVATTVLLLVAGAVVGFYLARDRPGPPAHCYFDAQTLIVRDELGREVWRKSFDEPFADFRSPAELIAEGRLWFGDLDGDGRIELLFVYDPVSRASRGSTLYCFSEKGETRWRYTVQRTVSTASESFRPPYFISAFLVLPPGKDGKRSVAVWSHHPTFYPAQVAVLSSGGVLRGEYWHSGHFVFGQVADVDGDGKPELLLEGISNSYKTTTVVVLDPENLGGASEEREAPAYQILGFGPGREKARLLFPRTCMSRKFEPYNRPSGLVVQPGSIQAGTLERINRPLCGTVYIFAPDLSLQRVEVNDGFRVEHQELEAVRQLDHPFTDAELQQLRAIRVLKHW